MHRGEGPAGDTLYTRLHQPLLIAWPYLVAALRQDYKQQAAAEGGVRLSSSAFSRLTVSFLSVFCLLKTRPLCMF